MFFEILRNISILLAFCMVYSLLFESRDRETLRGHWLLGIIFGSASVLAMLTPTMLFPGVLIDGRSVFISMAGLLGGWISGAIAVLISLICRAILGGLGAPVGYGIIVSSALIGVGYRLILRKKTDEISDVQFWLFGLAVHLVMVSLLFFLPDSVSGEVMRAVAFPVLSLYPAGTILVGRLLSIQHDRNRTRALILENQERLSSILRVAPTGIGLMKARVLVDINPRVSEISGYCYDELVGKSVRMLYGSKEEFLRVGMACSEQIQRRGTATIETAWWRKDGTLRDILLSATPVNSNDLSMGVTFTVLDMTNRKRITDALRESEEKFRSLVESSADLIWEIGPDMTYQYVSPQIEKILGYSPEEILGKTPRDLMRPDQLVRIEKKFWKVWDEGLPLMAEENVNVHKDGHPVILETSGVPVRDPAGKVVGYRGIDRDITQRKQAEEALKRSMAELQMHVEQTPLAVVRWDLDFRVAEWNRAAERVFGYSRAEAIGQHGSFLFFESEAEHLQRQWTRLIHSPDGFRSDNQNITRDQRTISCEWHNVALRDEAGNVFGAASQVMDVTERLKAEKERKQLMSAIEQSEEIVVITDADANIQYVNPSFERVTGYGRDEVMGQNPRLLQSGKHSALFYRNMWEVLSSGKPWMGQLKNKKKDGTIYVEDASISPVCDQNGMIVNYVAAKRDATRELELEDQLRQAQKMEAVGQMAGGIAHDFNNLLQVIGGYAELSMMGGCEDEACRTALDAILDSAMRGKKLVSQLLTFSRRQVIHPVDLNLNGVVDQLLQMVRGLIGEHIELRFVAAPELATVHADHGLMEQVLLNLCVNARDAMPDGGQITIQTENVEISPEFAAHNAWAKPGRYILFSVADDGCGMDAKMIEHIFEPFYTTKGVGKGTGLGLSTVFGIVKQHEGQILVESQPGRGSLFKIYLPAVDRAASDLKRVAAGAVKGGTETLLIAEDDETVLMLAEKLLSDAGYTVLVAHDGQEAIRVFEEHVDQIDGVMFDVVMPRLGGRQAMERILELRPGLPHLFASGYSDDMVHTNFIQQRGLHLLSKPYHAETLLREIRKVLDESPA